MVDLLKGVYMAEQTMKEVKKDIFLALHKAQAMVDLAEEGFLKGKVSALDESDGLLNEIRAKEDELTALLAKMASGDAEARACITVPGFIEKLALDIRRINENSRHKIKDGLLFSDKAMNEAARMFTFTRDMLKKTADTAVTGGAMDEIIESGDALGKMANQFATAHEERLVSGECQSTSSSVYLCILYAFEDIGMQTKNIARRLTGK